MNFVPGRLLGALLLLCLSSSVMAADAHTRLLTASKNQDWDAVSELLTAKDVDVNAAQADGATSLSWAVHWDNLKATRLLLDAGSDPNAANDYGITPLFLAIKNRNPDTVNALLEAGAEANTALWNGITPLLAAAKTGRVEVVNSLIKAGADVNINEPRRDQTALIWAISFGHPDVAKLLVEHGADISAKTKMLEDLNYSPIQLEGYRANVPGTEQGGYTPLMFAAKVGDFQTTKLLLSHGADINETSKSDGSALIIAAAQGHEELALYLLNEGSDPNVTDANGMTTLHYAMRDGLKVLHGYEIDFATRVCGFALNSRCKSFNAISEDEKRLLEDPSLDPNVGLYLVHPKEDPNDVLYGGNMYKLAEALLSAGASPDVKMKYPPPRLRMSKLPYFNLTNATPFFLASAALDLEAMSLLLEYGVDPKPKTEINKAVFEKQMQTYADDNQFQGDATALMAAVGLGRRNDFTPEEEDRALEAAKRLVNLGADVNAHTATGWTALHAAAYLGANKLVKFLVDNGAKLNVETGCGQSPVLLALGTSVKGLIERTVPHISTVEMLVQLGAADAPSAGRLGHCVLGRGNLETDTFQNDRVRKEVEAIKNEEIRKKIEAYL